jgi:hypothetical protein
MITSDKRGRIQKGTVIPCFIDGERPLSHLLTKNIKIVNTAQNTKTKLINTL